MTNDFLYAEKVAIGLQSNRSLFVVMDGISSTLWFNLVLKPPVLVGLFCDVRLPDFTVTVASTREPTT